MSSIPAAYHDLFERRTFAHLSTVMPDGTPHSTPVWIDYDADADRVLVNTARGRRKERNVRETPAVGGSMCDPEDPYRYVSVRGEVTTVTEEGQSNTSTRWLAGTWTSTSTRTTARSPGRGCC